MRGELQKDGYRGVYNAADDETLGVMCSAGFWNPEQVSPGDRIECRWREPETEMEISYGKPRSLGRNRLADIFIVELEDGRLDGQLAIAAGRREM